MSDIGVGELYLRARTRCVRTLRALGPRLLLSAGIAALAAFAVSPLRAQGFDPTLSVGGGIRTSYDHLNTTGGTGVDTFALNDVRLYLSGSITNQIDFMFNTDYSGNALNVLDAAGQFNISPKFHFWAGRFLEPSDRANMYGPFYADNWYVFSDGVQDGFNSVFQGRDNGMMYWGDWKAGIVKLKLSVGAFDGKSATGDPKVLFAGRAQFDFWDAENGYYLNGTYYGDKNLLAIAGDTQTQAGKTASSVDFLLEKKIPGAGALSIESEWADYNRLGGYNANYLRSEGAYGLAAFLFPQKIGIGQIQVLGKFAIAEFTDGEAVLPGHAKNVSYRQKTTEIDVNYVIKQFDARVMSFYKDERFNAIAPNTWEAGVGLQFQISKMVH
jgi:hypothetical protein